jgi:hypothetical protein
MKKSTAIVMMLFVACSFALPSVASAGTPGNGQIIFGDCDAGTTCVVFDWPDVPGAAYYLWEYRKDHESWPVGSDHQQIVTESEARDCYSEEGGKFWRVTTFDENDNPIKVCEEMEFYVNHCTPEIIGPCDEFIFRPGSPDSICTTFSWQPVAHGVGHYVWQYRKLYEPWGQPGTSIVVFDPEHWECFSEFGPKLWRFWVYDQAGHAAYLSDACFICVQSCPSPAEHSSWGSIKELWR